MKTATAEPKPMTEPEMEKAILDLIKADGPIGPYEMDMRLALAGVKTGSSAYKVLRIRMVNAGKLIFDGKRKLRLP